MTHININAAKKIGKIKPMHGVGQPPLYGTDTDMFHYLTEANIPYSRLHDVGGRFGCNMFVDIPNVFRDFSADENDPDSYDFVFTDIIISALVKAGCEPIYRLGVTIENFHVIKAYRIFPPSDMAKWARICEHIVRHYNEGWANGFEYNIKYWEIWNEPDGHRDIAENAMWKGTKEEYFELYRVTSKHLRKCFGSSIKIGGYASCGFYVARDLQDVTGAAFGTKKVLTDWEERITYFAEFFDEFIDIVKKEALPFDFFSHHSYADVKANLKMQAYCEQHLKKAGFENIEIHLNEWNTNPYIKDRGTELACANAVANMCAMHSTKMTAMCYYDAQVSASVYGGLFNPITREPFCAYYGFKAFGKLYALGTQVECTCDNPDVYTLAATNGSTTAVLLSNLGEDTSVELNLADDYTAYLIDQNNIFTAIGMHQNCLELKQNKVIYIETNHK